MGRLAARTPSWPSTVPTRRCPERVAAKRHFRSFLREGINSAFRAARRKARMAKPGVGVGCRPTALRDSRPAVLSRFLAAASLTAVALLVALGAGRSLGADAASPRAHVGERCPPPRQRAGSIFMCAASPRRGRPRRSPVAGTASSSRTRSRGFGAACGTTASGIASPSASAKPIRKTRSLRLVSRPSQDYRNIAVTTFSSGSSSSSGTSRRG